MVRTTRRNLVFSGICGTATLLAGCSSSPVDSGDGGGGSGSEPSREQVVDDRRDVAEDEYRYFSFDLNRPATFDYDFTVRSGPEIDVFLTDDQEFDEFQAGNRFKVYSSSYGTSGGDSVNLGEDSYRLVVDNTSAGNVEPPTNFDDDIAEVEVTAWVEG